MRARDPKAFSCSHSFGLIHDARLLSSWNATLWRQILSGVYVRHDQAHRYGDRLPLDGRMRRWARDWIPLRTGNHPRGQRIRSMDALRFAPESMENARCRRRLRCSEACCLCTCHWVIGPLVPVGSYVSRWRQYKRVSLDATPIGQGLFWGGAVPHPECAGYGVVYFAEKAINGRGDSLRGKRCVVTGSGKVSNLCRGR